MHKSEVITAVAARINAATSLDELLNYLVDKCIEVSNADTGSIMLLNRQSQYLEVKVSRGFNRTNIARANVKTGQGVTGWVAAHGRSLRIDDSQAVDYYIVLRSDLRSELAVPLKSEDRVFGVISLDSCRLKAFTAQDQELMEIIAVFAAQILKRLELVHELNVKINRQQLLLKTAAILEEEYDPEAMFDQVMQLLARELQLQRGFLVLREHGRELKTMLGFKLSRKAIERGYYAAGEGITGRVFKNGQEIVIRDISSSSGFLNKMKIHRGKNKTFSFYSFPLKHNNRVIGVLGVEKPYLSDTDFHNTRDVLSLLIPFLASKVYNYLQVLKEKDKLANRNKKLAEQLRRRETQNVLPGKSKQMAAILETVAQVAPTDATVLLSGPTGSGKEVMARLIHKQSNRFKGPFISINCAAIPANLLESELFGHVKGAFTGAFREKKGRFQLAEGGSILLDEIGDLDINLQAKILRVLQEKVIEPVGGEQSIRTDVRIMAATNKDLYKEVKEGRLREDLYYRLNVINITLPALRERQDDILLFIEYFIKRYNKRYQKKVKWITPAFEKAVLSYEWPGNIRELENTVERAVVLAKVSMLDTDLLPPGIRPSPVTVNDNLYRELIRRETAEHRHKGLYHYISQRLDKELIDYALVQCDNKHKEAAAFLGLHRNTLYQKQKKITHPNVTG
ncbi:MAG TPA: sigma-54-dependent Fis family transcriptional regulator [Spirochaetota bacterium]|nr:sigma-54-dependent Fis family transcriptional regulator [Spirochaetota bacterium]